MKWLFNGIFTFVGLIFFFIGIFTYQENQEFIKNADIVLGKISLIEEYIEPSIIQYFNKELKSLNDSLNNEDGKKI